MSELQEKREYYSDRSVKSIYFVDEQGRKQGKAKVFVQNSDIVEYMENYVDGILCKRERPKSEEYPEGMIEEFDENGNLERLFKQYCKYGDEYNETIYRENIDLLYKDGKPWTGYEIKEYGASFKGGRVKNDYRYFEGKLKSYFTEYHEKAHAGEGRYVDIVREELAHFHNGTLFGSYKAHCNNTKPDFKFINLKKIIKRNQFPYASYSVEGHFNNGIFSGKIECGPYYARNLYTIDNGNLTYSKQYLDCDRHWIITNYKDNRIEQQVESEKGKFEILRNGDCWRLEKGIKEEWEQKDGKKHGLAKKYNEKGWLESETQYKDGLKHGYETKYNSDGTIASQKYYENGVNCTMVHKALKQAWNKVASKRIEKEKAIEAETGVKTRLPKMDKGAKVVAMVKESLGLSK